jgi:hypothetical protein
MNNPNPQTNPSKPDEGQTLQPKPDTEVNPAGPGTNTEVDLDKSKTKTYPGNNPPERH